MTPAEMLKALQRQASEDDAPRELRGEVQRLEAYVGGNPERYPNMVRELYEEFSR